MPLLLHGESEAEGRVLRGLRLALESSALILVLEAFGAYFSRSLSVTIDAVHNLPDMVAFAASYAALRATRSGTSEAFTFGAHRLEVFAGLANAVLILGTGLVFGATAGLALVHGSSFAGPVDGVWILVVAVPTLALRAGNLVSLGRIPGRARDLNLASVLQHLASDLLITAALLAAGVLLAVRPSFVVADTGAALLIGAILVYESVPLFRDAGEVLTERTPRNISLEAVQRTLEAVPHVAEVHDLHVWAVCPTLICLTAHVRVEEMTVREGMEVVARMRREVEDDFGILHSTFEVEVQPQSEGLPGTRIASA
jgi:cobalt-zinc-cadmium efflux system protein